MQYFSKAQRNIIAFSIATPNRGLNRPKNTKPQALDTHFFFSPTTTTTWQLCRDRNSPIKLKVSRVIRLLPSPPLYSTCRNLEIKSQRTFLPADVRVTPLSRVHDAVYITCARASMRERVISAASAHYAAVNRRERARL